MRFLAPLLLCLLACPAWADVLIKFDGCVLAKGYNPEEGGPKLFERGTRFQESGILASRIISYRVFDLQHGSRDCIQVLTRGGYRIFIEILEPRGTGESSGQAIQRILKELIEK